MANPFQAEIDTISERSRKISTARGHIQRGEGTLDTVALLLWLEETNTGLARLLTTVGELEQRVGELMDDPMRDFLKPKQ